MIETLFCALTKFFQLWLSYDRSDHSHCFCRHYSPRQDCNIGIYYLDVTTIAYSCHTNWPIKIKMKSFHTLLCYNKCSCEGYYSFSAAKINVFIVFANDSNTCLTESPYIRVRSLRLRNSSKCILTHKVRVIIFKNAIRRVFSRNVNFS